jgi:TonB family protein
VPAADLTLGGEGAFAGPVDRVLAAREGRSTTRLRTAGAAGAVLLHAVLLAAATLGPRLIRDERPSMEFVPVALVPAQALGTPRAAPPRPAPEPPPPEPEVVPPEPEPEPEPERPVLPVPGDEPEEKPRPEAPRPAEPAPASPRPEAPAPGDRRGALEGSAAGTATSGATLAGVGDPSFTYGYYLDRMLAMIERNWSAPPTGDARPEVTLTFRILRDGRVADLEVAAPSGLTAFDLAGLRAVSNASPLPPLPSGYRKDSLSIRLIIR